MLRGIGAVGLGNRWSRPRGGRFSFAINGLRFLFFVILLGCQCTEETTILLCSLDTAIFIEEQGQLL